MNASTFSLWIGLLLVLLGTIRIDGSKQHQRINDDSIASSIPTHAAFSIERTYPTDKTNSYQQFEDSIRNFNDDTSGTLVVIDTEDGDGGEKKPTISKRSRIEKRDDDFDTGFTIIVDREDLQEQDLKKDQIYQEMEKSYKEIQDKFGEEIEQPVEEKHVRVIVITPKDEIAELEKQKQQSAKHQQTELELDIAKLQKVKEQMNTLNSDEKELVSNALNGTYEDINPTSKAEAYTTDEVAGKGKSVPTTLVEDMEMLDQIKSSQANNTTGNTFEQNQEILNPGSALTSEHITHGGDSFKENGTMLSSVVHDQQQPPGNPHPKHNAIEDHYQNKAITPPKTTKNAIEDHSDQNKDIHTKKAEKKSPSGSKIDDSEFVVERPKLPITWVPKANNSEQASNMNSLSFNMAEKATSKESNNRDKNKSDDKKPEINSNTVRKANQTLVENKPMEPKVKKDFKMPEPINKETRKNEATVETNKQSFTDQVKSATITKNETIKTSQKPSIESLPQLEKIITTSKAEAIIQYLNKDPLDSWRFPYNTLKSLNLDAELIRSGLVYPGYIERLKSVMKRAITGQDITLSIVGGSISAGGGLYKDQKSIEGLYYKGVVDWWNQWISPLTGSKMVINNVAIGSIGTDYFSYCVKNHINIDTDLVIWELAANDYNRYKTMATKGARPLERFTRIVLNLPKKPALMFVNFFKGIDYKNVRDDCPNFEDQQEHTIASYYHIPTLSWRKMVCSGLVHQTPGFLLADLFSLDQYHPSLKGHAQTALLILLHLRHVMRAVLQYAIKHNGEIANFNEQYSIPDPLFIGPKLPEPFCWSLIRPDEKDPVKNSLEVHIASDTGFSVQYATNFPIRFDKVVCWKSEKPMATLQLVFTIPKTFDNKDKRYEVAITTHSKWGGAAYIWLDDKKDQPVVIQEGRSGDPGKRTQVDSIANDVSTGTHFLNLMAKDSGGFCLAAIMIDAS